MMSAREMLDLAPVLQGTGARPAAAVAMHRKPVLALRQLAVRYGTAPDVFSGVDLSVEPGEQLALVGANGAGKSTLLKCCLGFARANAGSIHLFGESLDTAGAHRQRSLRGRIGFVAQKHNLVQRMTVLSNVVHGMLATHPGPRNWMQMLASRRVRQRAMEALDIVGLASFASRRGDALSGGQSQRVAIARALVAEPSLILADEPAASLDPAAGDEVMEAFARVSRDSGTTLIFTTHNLEHALRYAGRVAGLRGGRLELDAPASTLTLGGLRGLYG